MSFRNFFRIIGILFSLYFLASCNHFHEESEDTEMVEMNFKVDRPSEAGNNSVSRNSNVEHAVNSNMVTIGVAAVPASTTIVDVGFGIETYDEQEMDMSSDSVTLTVPLNEPFKILQLTWDKEYTIEEILSWEHMANFMGLSEEITVTSEDTEKAISISLEGIWSTMTTTDAPQERGNARGVWTGSEMCYWGGNDSVDYFNTGGCYDPDNDVWTTMTTTNAPSGRNRFAAAWTGSKMCIWGGTDGTVEFADGSCYDPDADNWTAMTSSGAPDARSGHVGVWTGSEMCIWGGFDGSGTFFNTGSCYDPSGDSWTAMANADAPVEAFFYDQNSAIWTGSEMCIWGGYNMSGDLNSGGCYDPIDTSWTAISTTNAPIARSNHTAVWTDSLMCIWGGNDTSGDFMDSGGCYNPDDDSWTTMTTEGNPGDRIYHSAVWTGTEMCTYGGMGTTYNYFGGCYNPSTDSWDQMSYYFTPEFRVAMPAIWTGSEFCVWSGNTSASYVNSGSCLYR